MSDDFDRTRERIYRDICGHGECWDWIRGRSLDGGPIDWRHDMRVLDNDHEARPSEDEPQETWPKHKRLEDAELAAEYWKADGDWMQWEHVAPSTDAEVELCAKQLRVRDALGRFACTPHYDEVAL